MSNMVKLAEFLLNVVNLNKPKMLKGLGQNGTVAGTGVAFSPVAVIPATGEKGKPKLL